MSGKNGAQQLLQQALRRGNLSSSANAGQTKQRRSQQRGKGASVLMLCGLALMLTACATQQAPPSSTPVNPEPPPSALPESPPNYSESAHALLSKFQRLLTELIAKPAN